MRKIATTACIHELAPAARRAKIDRRVACGLPARLASDIVYCMVEDVARGPGGSFAGNAQDVVCFHSAISHDRAEFDWPVADPLGWRVDADKSRDHVGDDANVDSPLMA